MEYFEPDSRWGLYQVTSVEEYTEKFVVKGKFHSSVPADIQEAWLTVEYILAHAYYHWPMYDEGLRKLLGIFEMAIKQRCEQLDIPLDYINKRRNRTESKPLVWLCNDLLKKEPYKPLKNEFEKARNVRNFYAHLKNNSYVGAIAKLGIIQVINTINFIFLPESNFKDAGELMKRLNNQRQSFEHGSLILDYNDKAYLVWASNLIDTWSIGDDSISLWCFEPVTNNLQQEISEGHFPDSLYLSLSNVQIDDKGITGIDLKTSNPVKLTSTSNPLNTKRFKSHLFALNNIEADKASIYYAILDHRMGEQLVQHRYGFYWSNNKLN